MHKPLYQRLFTRRNLLAIIGLTLFVLAMVVLRNEIQQFSWQTFREHFRLIPRIHFLWALLAAAGGYTVLTFYDGLALRYTGIRISWRRYAKASFLGFAFSHNITPSLIVGGTMRYRIYSPLGVRGFDVTRVVGFTALTLWVGFLTLGGILFLSTAPVLPAESPVSGRLLVTMGTLFALIILLYLLLCYNVRGNLVYRGRSFCFPRIRIALGQMAAGSADLLFSSAILYILLPEGHGISFGLFASLYLLAFMSGILSQVPGGLGVIETALVLLLDSWIAPDQILSAVLVYRAVYFIIPLVLATLLLGVHEYRQKYGKGTKAEADRPTDTGCRY